MLMDPCAVFNLSPCFALFLNECRLMHTTQHLDLDLLVKHLIVLLFHLLIPVLGSYRYTFNFLQKIPKLQILSLSTACSGKAVLSSITANLLVLIVSLSL